MEKFKVGDRVKCINNVILLTGENYSGLTLGKVYTVMFVSLIGDGCNEFIRIVADNNTVHDFYSSRFELDIKYERSEKLKSIGF